MGINDNVVCREQQYVVFRPQAQKPRPHQGSRAELERSVPFRMSFCNRFCGWIQFVVDVCQLNFKAHLCRRKLQQPSVDLLKACSQAGVTVKGSLQAAAYSVEIQLSFELD